MAISLRNLFGRRDKNREAEKPQQEGMGLYETLKQGDNAGAIRPGNQQYRETYESEPADYIGDEGPVRRGGEDDAYELGQRMGARAMLEMQGADRGSLTGYADQQETGGGPITKDDIIKAGEILMRYRAGKASLERRIISNQEWWKLRNWEMIQIERGTKGAQAVKSSTAWLWYSIIGKHADMMDIYPEPIFLPREASDKEEAKRLTEIVPLILQENHFEDTYDATRLQKLTEGTGAYGVFWDKTKLNGLGDVVINKVNLLNLFWEPGISDIEDSKNVFFVYLADDEDLLDRYPQLEGKVGSNSYLIAEYLTDDSIPKDGKSAVVDWYYKKWQNGKRVLHLCTFCNGEILYSTENQGLMDGLYEDGEYPFVLDPMYRVEGSPAGYGMIDIGKDTQMDIDTLNQAMVLNAVVNATPRHFVKKDGSVNEEEYADLSKMFVHVNGMLGDDSIRLIQGSQMSGYVMNMLQEKIDELKQITGNTDVNNGGVPAGVTAASAIAALQEESGRTSKDTGRGDYRAVNKVTNKVVSRVRQGYDIARMFRITGKAGEDDQFVAFDNSGLKPQPMQNGMGLEGNMRLPVFDIEIRAQRESAYTKLSQNELALQLYKMGFFLPQNADPALMCLNMLEFKGKDELMQQIRKNGTLLDMFQKVSQIAMALAQQYNPMMAQQIAMITQGITGQATMPATGAGGEKTGLPEGDNMEKAPTPGQENQIVARAKERSANASRPN